MDLTGVMQMLGQGAGKTGALTINAGETDAVLFLLTAVRLRTRSADRFFGDEAVIHILKNCVKCGSGVLQIYLWARLRRNARCCVRRPT